jgi:hypothetical protein
MNTSFRVLMQVNMEIIITFACLICEVEQYLKMMTNMPISHPFRRPAVLGELPRPLLLAPLAKGRSYFSVEC